MKFIGLVSGGKDSIYSICKLIDQGHCLVALLHMRNREPYQDSYMFQTVGSEFLEYVGRCFGTDLHIHETKCKPLMKDIDYTSIDGDEVEDMIDGIGSVLKSVPFDGVCSGAILSIYQKNRVEYACRKLNLTSLTPLWNRDQKMLLDEMIDYGLESIVVKVASPIFAKSNIGNTLRDIRSYLGTQDSKYPINYCGEGGEYETITLDCRHFIQKIIVEEYKIAQHPEDIKKDSGVFYLIGKKIGTVPKSQ